MEEAMKGPALLILGGDLASVAWEESDDESDWEQPPWSCFRSRSGMHEADFDFAGRWWRNRGHCPFFSSGIRG
jgi:hypothetical protein